METMHYTLAAELISAMQSQENPEKRNHLMRFFKTDKGQYGEGDRFLGLTTPQTRAFVKTGKDMPLEEVEKLLLSPWHEVRLCGFLILVSQFERSATSRLADDHTAMLTRDHIAGFYIRHCHHADNWDLVDLSCYKILGRWLTLPSSIPLREREAELDKLAASGHLWKERISMVSTMGTLKVGNPAYTLKYAEIHLHHPHDLMHKAVGWMLREMGKRCGMDLLREFLSLHAAHMPRTALRYAIEHMTPEERHRWMNKTI